LTFHLAYFLAMQPKTRRDTLETNSKNDPCSNMNESTNNLIHRMTLKANFERELYITKASLAWKSSRSNS